jgi:uncharacterized membrane protein
VILLGAAMAVSAALIIGFSWHTTFFGDTWELLIERRDPSLDTLLKPHNEHLIVFPVLISELLIRIFGMSDDHAELLLLVAMLCGAAGLIYAYVERRVGSWPALFAAALILFLGPAYEVLLWPFEITFVGPMIFGIAALLALEGGTRRGDIVACVCLTLGLGFSDLGVPFLAAGLVAVLVGPRERWLTRSYVWAVPAFLFAVWYVGWGHEAETHIGIHNILIAPSYVAGAISTAVGALSGLGTEESLAIDPIWSRVLTVALVGVVALWWSRHRPRIDRVLWPVLAVALANWVLTALNTFGGREPTASRYQYGGAIFVLLILSCIFSGVRPSRNWLIALAVGAVLAIGPNIVVLHEASKLYKRETAISRADTAALEIASRTVEPEFQLNPEISGTPVLVNVLAGPYLEAVAEHGSPAYSIAELETAPPEGRNQADIVLAHALPLSTATTLGEYDSAGGENCVAAGATGREEVRIDPGKTRIEVAPGTEATLSMRRFASPGEFPVALESAPGGSTTVLTVPRDNATNPWYLHVDADQTVRVCR